MEKSRRQKLISKAHVLKSQLGLDDSEFDQLKHDVTGLSSIRKMDMAHLSRFVARLEKLIPRADQDEPAQCRRLSPAQCRKILKLGLDVLNLQPVQINSFLYRMVGKKKIDWLTASEACKVIEGMIAINKRKREHGDENASTQKESRGDTFHVSKVPF